MSLPRLQDFDALLNRKCADVLGDPILYRPAGGSSFFEIRAIIDYSDKTRSIEGVEAMDQAISCEVLKADVPAKPDKHVRIQLDKAADRQFRPMSVGSTEDGDHWIFDLKDVTADG